MKKLWILGLGLALSSPFVLAQNQPPPAPSLPSVVPGDQNKPEATPPTTDDQGNTTTGAKSGNNSATAKGNPNSKSGTIAGKLDFKTLDGNSDGMLSRSEATKGTGSAGAQGTTRGQSLGARFDQLDSNHDGNLDQAEFSAFTGPSDSGSSNDPSTSDRAKSKVGETKDKAKEKTKNNNSPSDIENNNNQPSDLKK